MEQKLNKTTIIQKNLQRLETSPQGRESSKHKFTEKKEEGKKGEKERVLNIGEKGKSTNLQQF